MADYHVGQDFRLQVETNITLTGATLLIKFTKSNGRPGEFSATINGSDASKMYYDVDGPAKDLDIAGDWIFWGHAVQADGSVNIGKAVVQAIKAEGQV